MCGGVKKKKKKLPSPKLHRYWLPVVPVYGSIGPIYRQKGGKMKDGAYEIKWSHETLRNNVGSGRKWRGLRLSETRWNMFVQDTN